MVVYSESRMSSIDINSFCVHVSLNGRTLLLYSESRMSSIDINSFCVHVSLNGSVQ